MARADQDAPPTISRSWRGAIQNDLQRLDAYLPTDVPGLWQGTLVGGTGTLRDDAETGACGVGDPLGSGCLKRTFWLIEGI